MKLLFTGASGFLGNNIYPLLKDNYSIATIGLALQDNYSANLAIEIPNLIVCICLIGVAAVLAIAGAVFKFARKRSQDR